ncbi:MAG: 50S ribosomal protein L15 [Candidatus Omnitrophica bacterium]|nr:50S ribosomal protein L15 [Candidatus Omnitrophota bacterium]
MAIIDYLVLPKGAKKNKKRRGKGQGSGHGKTACRGHKGQTARGNTKKYKGFEGGQMPLVRRLPKRGFTNKFKKEYQVVNIRDLKKLSTSSSITPGLLYDKGIVKSKRLLIKILGDGSLKKAIEIHAHAFSKVAKKAIEDAGGKAVLVKKTKDKEVEKQKQPQKQPKEQPKEQQKETRQEDA